MAYEVYIPKLGANMQDGMIDAWYVKEGDETEIGSPLFDLVTDKATVTVEAEQRGVIRKILTPAGETVPIVTTVAIIGTPDEDISELLEKIEKRKIATEEKAAIVEAAPAPAVISKKSEPLSPAALEAKPDFMIPSPTQDKPLASPAARKMAKDAGIDIRLIPPSLEHGIITTDDVIRFTASGGGRKKVVIIGAGEYGRVILEIIRLEGKFLPAGFIDDNPAALGKEIDGIKVIGGTKDLESLKAEGIEYFIVSVGSPKPREMLFNKCLEAGLQPINAIHPMACVSASARIEAGCVVEAFSVVAVYCLIHRGTFITQNCSVSHDCKIGEFSHLAPGCHMGGSVNIGRATLLGVGSAIAPHIEIGDNVIITPGTSVDRSLDSGSVMEGVPGRIIGSTRRDRL
jgi:acetyltransferase EpsM